MWGARNEEILWEILWCLDILEQSEDFSSTIRGRICPSMVSGGLKVLIYYTGASVRSENQDFSSGLGANLSTG